MRTRLAVPLLLAAAVFLGSRGSSFAEESVADRRAKVVARVGARAITAGELEDRLGAVPRFQLASFGDTPDAIRKKFLNEVIIPEALLSLGAEDKKIDQSLPTKHEVERARSSAMLREVRNGVGAAAAIPIEDVKRYYDANKSRFDAPDRYGVWRILVKTKEEAEQVLALAKKDATPKRWNELAREKSIDKATYLRGGNLGFVTADGVSNEAGLKVDPALPKAAMAVKDGEFVAAPVAEGEFFAVVWRRGTVAATRRTVEEVAPQIRDTLWKQRVEAAEKKLLDELVARDVKDVNKELLDMIDISLTDGTIAPRRRPGQAPPR